MSRSDIFRKALELERERDEARAMLHDTAEELSGWINDGSVLCGCRQHEVHGQNGNVKVIECKSHRVLRLARGLAKP